MNEPACHATSIQLEAARLLTCARQKKRFTQRKISRRDRCQSPRHSLHRTRQGRGGLSRARQGAHRLRRDPDVASLIPTGAQDLRHGYRRRDPARFRRRHPRTRRRETQEDPHLGLSLEPVLGTFHPRIRAIYRALSANRQGGRGADSSLRSKLT